MSMPGVILSQFVSSTSPSKAWAMAIGLHHVRDQFARRQRIMHAQVAHGNAVADAGQAEEQRPAAAGVHALFDEPLQIAHADMAGDQVGKARGNADHGLVELAPG